MSEPTSSIWSRRTSEKSAFLASTGVKPAWPDNKKKEEEDKSKTRMVMPYVLPKHGSHFLEHSWTVWFLHRGPGVKISNYMRATKQLDSFSTVEEFWSTYAHLRRVNRLQYASEYQIFQKGVKPMWEDPHNVNGGKWVLRYRRPPFKDRRRDDNGIPADVRNSHKHTRMRFQAAYNWEVLVLSVIGGSFSEGLGLEHDEILGLVVSVRREEDIISVWNKRGQDEEVREKIRGALVRVLSLDGDVTETDDSGIPRAVPEYKVHSQSIREGAAKQAIYEASREKQQRFGVVAPTVDGSAAMTTTAIISPPSEPTVVL